MRYNEKHDITPQSISKSVRDITARIKTSDEKVITHSQPQNKEDTIRIIKELEGQMKVAARSLEFEKAALIRDEIIQLRRELGEYLRIRT
jgi:excinuclease ABC subunit B